MASLLGVGVLVMVVADSVVGLRLLRLAWRSRQLPEALLGTTLIGFAGVGYPLSITARRAAEAGEVWAEPLLGAALAAQNGACIAMLVFTWWTFRRTTGARIGLLLGLLALVTSPIAPLAGAAASWDSGPFYALGFAGRAGAFAWASTEAWLYWQRLRRQARLGIGPQDAAVLDRFRLWGIGSAAVVVGFALFLGARLAGLDVARNPWLLVSTSAAGLISGITIWLAFLPPRAYLARVRRVPATHG